MPGKEKQKPEERTHPGERIAHCVREWTLNPDVCDSSLTLAKLHIEVHS